MSYEDLLDMISAAGRLNKLVLEHVIERAETFPAWLDLSHIHRLCAEPDFDVERGMVEVILRGAYYGDTEWGTCVDIPLAELTLEPAERMAIWQAEEDARKAKEDAAKEIQRQKREAQERAQLDELTRKYGVA